MFHYTVHLEIGFMQNRPSQRERSSLSQSVSNQSGRMRKRLGLLSYKREPPPNVSLSTYNQGAREKGGGRERETYLRKVLSVKHVLMIRTLGHVCFGIRLFILLSDFVRSAWEGEEL